MAVDDARTAFWIACSKGNEGIVRLLLSVKKIVEVLNKPNLDGESPLYTACQQGHGKVVMVLLREKKVDVNQKQKEGLSPLVMAARNGNMEMIKMLLASGRHFDQLDWSPLTHVNPAVPKEVSSLLRSYAANKFRVVKDLRTEISKKIQICSFYR